MAEIKRINIGPRMSDIVIHNGTAYLAGKVASNPEAGIAAQTANVLQTIDRLLAEAGTDKSRVLRADIFLKSMADFAEMNKVWDAWVVPGVTPARATTQSELARTELLIEIVIVAAL